MANKTLLFIFSLLIIGFVSCRRGNISPAGINLVLTPVEQQKAAADNGFTIKLFKNLESANTGNVNLFVSPLSVSFAFGMTSNGSNGETLAAINSAMSFNGYTQGQVNSYYNKLITELPELDPGTTLKIANSIWYSQVFSVLPQFLQTNTNFYKAEVKGLDFNSPASLNTINNWVDMQTDGNIPAILNQISPGDSMILVNAIYFKSGWKEKFDPAKTGPLPFYLDNGSQVQANFMDGTVDYNRYNNSEVSVFELPYFNNKYSMVIVMPSSGTTVQQLVLGLDSAKWQTWIAALNPANSELKLPKFTFSYNILLNSALSSLGMGIAFTDKADFSGITTNGPLHITRVTQKAYVDADEAGTTAAAATTVEFGDGAAAQLPPTIINRPFMFVIRQVSSGLILFAGTVNNPLLTGN